MAPIEILHVRRYISKCLTGYNLPMPTRVIEIVTPKKFILNGLWFGPRRPSRTIIWVHGLGSSAFSKLEIVRRLADKSTSVITFNNRGHDKAAIVARTNGGKKVLAGASHEVFTDCADDIQGVINFVRKAGIQHIYLAGHSTGCQKSIYWASRKKAHGVKGIILLAPISDYSAELMLQGKQRLARAAAAAHALVRRGKKHELLPADMWHDTFDAQRFLSLYTPDSVEEIFSYAQPKKIPRILKSVRVPLLVLLAERDEYGDRPAKRIAQWFEKHLACNHKILVIRKSPHSFLASERTVAAAIRRWIRAQ